MSVLQYFSFVIVLMVCVSNVSNSSQRQPESKVSGGPKTDQEAADYTRGQVKLPVVLPRHKRQANNSNKPTTRLPITTTTTTSTTTTATTTTSVPTTTTTSTTTETPVEKPTVVPSPDSCNSVGMLFGLGLGCLLAGILLTLGVHTLLLKRGPAMKGIRQLALSWMCCGCYKDQDINTPDIVAPPRSSVTFLEDHPPHHLTRHHSIEQKPADSGPNVPFNDPIHPVPLYLEFDNKTENLPAVRPVGPPINCFTPDEQQQNHSGYLTMTPQPFRQVDDPSYENNPLYQNVS